MTMMLDLGDSSKVCSTGAYVISLSLYRPKFVLLVLHAVCGSIFCPFASKPVFSLALNDRFRGAPDITHLFMITQVYNM